MYIYLKYLDWSHRHRPINASKAMKGSHFNARVQLQPRARAAVRSLIRSLGLVYSNPLASDVTPDEKGGASHGHLSFGKGHETTQSEKSSYALVSRTEQIERER